MKKEIKVETRGRHELPESEKLVTVRVGIMRKIVDGIGKKELQAKLKSHSETLVIPEKRKKSKK